MLVYMSVTISKCESAVLYIKGVELNPLLSNSKHMHTASIVDNGFVHNVEKCCICMHGCVYICL